MSPVDAFGVIIPDLARDLERAPLIILDSLEISTRRSYGTGLLLYNVYADTRGLSETARFPPSPQILVGFVAAITGAYASGTISTFLSGLRAWHNVHLLPWLGNDVLLSKLVRGAEKHAPAHSTLSQKPPLLPPEVVAILAKLDPTVPLDCSCRAALCVGFWTQARCGEITVPNLEGFDPARHPTREAIRTVTDREGNKVRPAARRSAASETQRSRQVTAIRLPFTKSRGDKGDDLIFAAMQGIAADDPRAAAVASMDPDRALAAHLALNNPPTDKHLFSYRHGKGHRPLTRHHFLGRIRQAANAAGLAHPPSGHGMRIGGTLEYLLRGLSFETVKALGRWASDTFHDYLRRHAQVLAAHLQNSPELMERFARAIVADDYAD
jgi:hypothetical protein